MKSNSPRTLVVMLLLVAAAVVAGCLRLLPYSLGPQSALTPLLWNFTPILAMVIFGVAMFKRPEVGLVAPLVLLALTDAFLHATGLAPSTLGDRALVYITYAALGLLGLMLKNRRTWPRFLVVCLAGPVGFFLITNFVHWLMGVPTLEDANGYPKTFAGLLKCYVEATPFLRNDLIGTTFFLGSLFGAYAWAEARLPALAESEPVLAG